MGKKFICAAIVLTFFAAAPVLAQEKKAKPLKVTGDVGLLEDRKSVV